MVREKKLNYQEIHSLIIRCISQDGFLLFVPVRRYSESLLHQCFEEGKYEMEIYQY